ncbi:MAG TPA: mycofactocin system transcriptional regulator [Mycobacteriales bacterium]|nr:mycofactocin system transcriptional regulator [Mycobacteriales bacterium]
MQVHDPGADRPVGRRPVSSPQAIEKAAFALFDRNGFEATTVDDIAHAAGIGRRTFFRYFASKNDVVWGDWQGALIRMRRQLAAAPVGAPLAEVLRDAVVGYNRIEPSQVSQHRRRMELVLHVPALQAHSTLRYAEWRDVVADFVATRTDQRSTDLLPQLTAHAALGAAVTAYEQWLRDAGGDADDLAALLHECLTRLAEWGRA